ncbi:MAG: EAL domain-containing protein [Sulfuritalea sp.]|nr:EAL domain-containing protein [Sulfuritalea sp.]
MKKVFSPAISLMNKLRIPQKFMGLALICLVAVAALGYSLYVHLSQAIGISQRELEGIALIKASTRTMQLLQQHRGLTSGLLSGEESMREARASKEIETATGFNTVAGLLSPRLASSEDWSRIQADWEEICKAGLNWSANKSFLAHSSLLGKLQSFRTEIADRHSLSFDPDIDAHYLLQTAIVDLPVTLEKIGQIRGLGTGILAKKKISGNQQLQMHALITELHGARKSLAFNMDKAARYNPRIQAPLTVAFKDFDEALLQLLARIQADIMAEPFDTSSGSFFKMTSAVIDQGYLQLHQTLLPTAEALIDARIQRAETELLFSASMVFLLLLIVGYLFAGIYYSTFDSIQSLTRSAERFSLGDMSQRVSLNTQDELRQIGDSFNQMADGFNALLAARREDEDRLRAIVGSALDAVIQMDADGKISGWSKQAEVFFGWTREEAVGRKLHETIIPVRYRDAHIQGLSRFLASGDGPVLNTRVEIEGLHREGHEFPIELAISSIQTARGIEFSAFARDITERKATEDKLRKLSMAVEQSPESIVITNLDAEIEYVNEAFVLNTGYSREEAIGRNLRFLRAGKTPPETYAALWDALTHGQSWNGEFHNRRKDGSEYIEHALIAPIRHENGIITHYVAVKEDITARKAAESRINQLAFYDPLTSLPNRRLLLDRLGHAMASSTRNARYGALLLIDLDNFKALNDTLGHDIGDLLLQQVAQRLANCVREGDTMARLGGDEFMVILEDLSENALEAATRTETVGEKILAALGQPYQLANYEHHSTPSIGITLFTNHRESIDELMKRAELAMYQAKAAGRNTLRFFDLEMQTVVTARAALEADLREAVLKSQFLLHYQAQVAGDGRVTGVEVLVRWQHPERGLVSPFEFIALSEDTGLILPLGHWVLETACAQLAFWAARPEMAHLTVAVNVSARQFHHRDFVNQVLAILERTGASPQRLKLELTESLLVHDVEGIIVKMTALKAKGVSFSLDDFGTGYSSLSYLKRLPFDQLKIDQSFVSDMLSDPSDVAIARAVVALGQSLGIAVIAEGVETEAQRNCLATNGCHAYQGFLFSRPLSIESFEEFAQRV